MLIQYNEQHHAGHAIDEAGDRRLSAVLPGLTPEVIGSRWPAQTELTAVDHSEAVIRALWPAPDARPAQSGLLCADRTAWLASTGGARRYASRVDEAGLSGLGAGVVCRGEGR